MRILGWMPGWHVMSTSSTNKSISLLLICQSYPPVIGGSEIEAQRVCEALIKRGHCIKVVCAGGDPMPRVRDWIDPKGVPVRIYAAFWKGTLRNIVFALRVAGMLIRERRNYQSVYFLMQGLHVAVGLPVARLLRKPILMKISSSIVIPELKKSLSGRLQLRWLREWAQCVMILNEGVRQQAIEHGLSPDQLLWMPNPVDTEEFAPGSDSDRRKLRSQFGIPVTAPLVMYCGRLASVKALPSLIDAFALVARQMPEAMLVLLGDGPERTALMEQAKRLHLSEKNVRFAGRLEPAEINSWLRIADAFTLVSLSEGFACSLAEAMSTGLASVVSDIPANRQLIKDGENGLLVPARDSEAIAVAILRVLGDAQMRERMGREARRIIVENYTTNQVADQYEAVFHQILER
jgi:glycosyltransferase involved in cell wall biosynthesis